MRLCNLSSRDLVVPASRPRQPPLLLPRPRDRVTGAPVRTPELVDVPERAGSLGDAKAWGASPRVEPALPPYVEGRRVLYVVDRDVALWLWGGGRKWDVARPFFERYGPACLGLVRWALVGGVARTVVVDIEEELIA